MSTKLTYTEAPYSVTANTKQCLVQLTTIRTEETTLTRQVKGQNKQRIDVNGRQGGWGSMGKTFANTCCSRFLKSLPKRALTAETGNFQYTA